MAASTLFRPLTLGPVVLAGLAAVTALSTALPETAQAQTYLCPGGPGEGESQIGMASGPGFQGAAVCFANPEYVEDEPLVDPTWERQVSPETTREKIAEMRRSLETLHAMQRNMERTDPGLSVTPLAPDYDRGFWTYSAGADGPAASGERCMVLFTSAQGLVGIFGPEGAFRGAMLMFWSDRLPKPKDPQTAVVSLLQNHDAAAQNVRTYSYTEPRGGAGVIAIGIPSAEAVLSTMLDDQRFRLTVDNGETMDISWHSGLEARDKLRTCLAAG